MARRNGMDTVTFLHSWMMYFLGWQRACQRTKNWREHRVAREAYAELQRMNREQNRGWGV